MNQPIGGGDRLLGSFKMLLISASLTATQLQAAPRASLGLTYSVTDTDTFITSVTSVVDWGDGTQDRSGTVANPYGPTSLVHAYQPGIYQVKVTASNFRSPLPDTVIYQQAVTVVPAARIQTNVTPITFGPILPRTNGYPSPAEWSFNTGRDGAILESSLLMLLLTRRGERVYDADYGTNLGQLVFSPSDEDVSARAREDIVRAVASYEPRVELVGVDARVDNTTRSLFLSAEFRSKLSGQPLVLSLSFAA